jgi:pimeloyl-ACP methyl ester carboxylesterase
MQRTSQLHARSSFLLTLCIGVACAPYPTGIRETPEGTGPAVVIDWDAKPLPEIPLPNDLATRPDPTSLTGLRLNISELAPTEMERKARRKINELIGFGIYAPFTVSFDEALDLDEIKHRHEDDGNFSDDAFFLIDVDPDSPDYLRPVRLDVGHGRFPADLDQTDRYFPNDPRSDSPALLFETAEEDLNQNGILDPGEDTDNDGVLDHPNVWPKGGDPREDLMTWYERETNTLIIRPVVPLREENTYAVVLTERLVGEDGQPVRSPWEYVHHTRQTEALSPAMHALPQWGVDVDDVAYAWTFTTGRITGDLVDLRKGLDGDGPWHWLGDAFPATIGQGLTMHEDDDIEDVMRLPVSALLSPVAALGFFGSDEAAGMIVDAYDSFASDIVGGSFISPNLLTDSDDGGRDDTDEYWKLDPVSGTMVVGPQRIVFTCVLPKHHDDGPVSVAIFGHGYGSSRFDMFGFSWAMNRMGFAACAMDYPGHGPTINESEEQAVEALLENLNLTPFLKHLQDSRQRDVNNDGKPDSGADQWIADSFHTRDMVRQAALDNSQWIKALRACGEGTMETETGSRMTCDWNDDGIPDLGGPDAEFFLVGGSLGGINSAVTAAIEPEVTASASIVGAGGMMDIGIRSPLKGVVEAVIGRLITPLILGTPDEDGGLVLSQHVISGRDQVNLPFATLEAIPAGGEILLENLENGEERLFHIPDDGRLRVPIPADAADAFGKRVLTGMPDEGPGTGVWTVENNEGLGDPLRLTIWDEDGNEVAVIDTFETEAMFEGVTYTVGSPLVAASEGLGHMRGSPSLRRLASFTGLIIEPGDPISYARAYLKEPFKGLGGIRNTLIIPTPGDMIVAVNAEIALARAAGMIDYENIDPRYGMTVDQWLIDTEVVRGLEQFGPWVDVNGNPALFDPDDLDNGTDDYGAPSHEPLRVTIQTEAGVSGMRMPYVNPNGSHGFATPLPSLSFDINSFAIHQIGRYFQSGGQTLTDDPCMADHTCDWLTPFEGGAR